MVMIAEGKKRSGPKYGWYVCPGCQTNRVNKAKDEVEKQLCGQCRSARQSADLARSAEDVAVATDQARKVAEFAATSHDLEAVHNAALSAQKSAGLATATYEKLKAKLEDERVKNAQDAAALSGPEE